MVTGIWRKVAKKIYTQRRIHCFCLGAAKTGTTSFSAMFETYYDAAHEPETVKTTDAVATILGDQADSLDVVAWLRARDQRLKLEVEASHPLGYMAPWLPEAFPEARFVITLRDPLPWLKSRLNFHYYKTPPEWQKYRDLIWGRWHKGYHDEEKFLEEKGLYSIDAYLAQYSEQYELLFKHLPEQRRLLIKTEALDTSIDRIADFLQIAPASILRKHANAFSHEESIIDRLPEEFVTQRIEAHCQWMKTIL